MEVAGPGAEGPGKPNALHGTGQTATTCDPANLSTGELTTEDLELSARENPSRTGTEDQEWAINDNVACQLSREVLGQAGMAMPPGRPERGARESASDVPENIVSVQGNETPEKRDLQYEHLVSCQMANAFASSLVGDIDRLGEEAILNEALLLGQRQSDERTAESVASFRTAEQGAASMEDEALRGILEKLVQDVARGLPEGILPAQCGPGLVPTRPAVRARRGLDDQACARVQDGVVHARPNSECSIASMVPGQAVDEKTIEKKILNEVSLELWQDVSKQFDQAMLQADLQAR